MSSNPYLTETEKMGISQIRHKIGDRIPSDLNTDFLLARWWRSYRGNLGQLCSKFVSYVETRRACEMGYDYIKDCMDDPITAKAMPWISISKLDDRAWTDKKNGFLLIEKGLAQPKQWVKVTNCFDYLYLCFRYCEYIQQLILKREAETGRPATGILIFDMCGINILDWLNPLAAHDKIWHLRCVIWQEYFPELVQHIAVVHPPSLLSLFWQVAKLFVNENTRKHLSFYFAHKSKDVVKYLEPEILPVHYGGKYKDTVDWGDPDTCCSVRRKYREEDYYQIGSVWKQIQVKPPVFKHALIKPHHQFLVEEEVTKAGAKLAWQFWTNGEVLFGVTRHDDDEGNELVMARFPLITAVLPEERVFQCHKPGRYVLEFENKSSFFNLKLEYAVLLAE